MRLIASLTLGLTWYICLPTYLRGNLVYMPPYRIIGESGKRGVNIAKSL